MKQIKVLGDLLSNGDLCREQLMYIMSELPLHGLFDYKKVLPKLREINNSSIFEAKLRKKTVLWSACQAEIRRSNLIKNSSAMKALYGEKSFFFKNPKDKSGVIIVVFTTMFNNFHFSNAVLASILLRSGKSFLLVKDPTQKFYLNGIPDFGSDLVNSSRNLQYFLQKNGFSDIRITSYSSGGYASILYASKIKGVNKVVCFSPRTDYSEGGSRQSGNNFERIRDEVPKQLCKNLKDLVDFSGFSTSIIFGSENKIDQSHAENLFFESNVQIRKILGCDHYTPSALLASGTFEKVLMNLLF